MRRAKHREDEWMVEGKKEKKKKRRQADRMREGQMNERSVKKEGGMGEWGKNCNGNMSALPHDKSFLHSFIS